MPGPTSQFPALARFSLGLITGALLVWALCAAWIELFPTSVLPPRYARNVAIQTMMHQCDSDVALFGDSRVRAGIDPNSLNLPALNLAEGAYNPAVDFYRARELLKCPHRPRVVILSYSMLQFRALPPFLMNDFFIDRLISNSEIQEIVDTIDRTHDWDILTFGHYDSTPPLVSLPVRVRTILYRIDLPLFYAPSMLASLESGVLPRWHVNQQTYVTTFHNRGQYPFVESEKSDAIFSDVDVGRYPRSAVMDLYFDKLVGLLAQNHIPVLILTMPINQPTFDALGAAPRQAHEAYLQGYATGRPNVTVVEPVLAPWPSEMFTDGSGHPNRRGQIEATRLVQRCITAVLATVGPVDPKACSIAYNAL